MVMMLGYCGKGSTVVTGGREDRSEWGTGLEGAYSQNELKIS